MLRPTQGSFFAFLLPVCAVLGKLFLVDDLDRKIIAELQRDGRLTVTQLAARVHLSVSPCHRRLRHLERSGTISGYRAIVDPSALGLRFATLVFVTMRQEDRRTVAAFEKAVVDVPNVVQAQRLFGDPDYLLRIVCEDLAAYQRLYDEQLATLPGVQRLTSTLVMKDVVLERAATIHATRGAR
jgi:DNA-binding Lrp family transcriptional regulator